MPKKKKKYIVFKTPAGAAKWVYVNSPDTEYDAEGEYKIKLVFDPDDIQDLCDKIHKMAVKQFNKIKAEAKPHKAKILTLGLPYGPEYDQDGEETGKIEMRFKSKTEYTSNKGDVVSLKPDVFDAGRKVIDGPVNIGNGSICKVASTPSVYHVKDSAGVTLRFNALQIIELKAYKRSAADYGFAEEEGFSGDEVNSKGSEEELGEMESDDGDF